MRALLLCHSRTGTTLAAARALAGELTKFGVDSALHEVRPRVDLPYPLWLLVSFFPGVAWPVADSPDPARFDRLVLAFPKWTFNHPLVETLVRRMGTKTPPVALLVTCGGWDQERYAAHYRREIEGRGAKVVETLVLRKRDLGGEGWRASISAFAATVASKG